VLIATGLRPAERGLIESVLMQHAESTVHTLGALKAMGVRLAINDLGNGCSRFSYLRRFPVDGSCINPLFRNSLPTRRIRPSNLGKSLEIGVIA
jgi:EAL domain-containing protein (putative c-di-GMP-specific phosphodiesterase class I)